MEDNAKEALALNIRKAAKTREDSWEMDQMREYALSIHEACFHAIPDKQEAELIYMLLILGWNDALEWAGKVIGD